MAFDADAPALNAAEITEQLFSAAVGCSYDPTTRILRHNVGGIVDLGWLASTQLFSAIHTRCGPEPTCWLTRQYRRGFACMLLTTAMYLPSFDIRPATVPRVNVAPDLHAAGSNTRTTRAGSCRNMQYGQVPGYFSLHLLSPFSSLIHHCSANPRTDCYRFLASYRGRAAERLQALLGHIFGGRAKGRASRLLRGRSGHSPGLPYRSCRCHPPDDTVPSQPAEAWGWIYPPREWRRQCCGLYHTLRRLYRLQVVHVRGQHRQVPALPEALLGFKIPGTAWQQGSLQSRPVQGALPSKRDRPV